MGSEKCKRRKSNVFQPCQRTHAALEKALDYLDSFLLPFFELEHDRCLWINSWQDHLSLGGSVSAKRFAVLEILTGSSCRWPWRTFLLWFLFLIIMLQNNNLGGTSKAMKGKTKQNPNQKPPTSCTGRITYVNPQAKWKSSASEYLHLVHKFGILSEREVGGPGSSVFVFSCALLYIPTMTVFSSTHYWFPNH